MFPRLLPALAILGVLAGCAHSKYAGTWTGKTIPGKGVVIKNIGDSNKKPPLDNTLTLNGDGSFDAKFLDVISTTGKWTATATELTLNTETYMGLARSQISIPKKKGSASDVDSAFKPCVLEIGPGGKSLILTSKQGTATLTKSDS